MGIKEMVRAGQLTAKSALNRLGAKADLAGETKIFKSSKTYRWLVARLPAK